MFSSNLNKESDINQNKYKELIDPVTIWLIRVTCILLIIIFTGILIGLPLVFYLGKSQVNNLILTSKDILRTIIDLSLN
tara:strand:+ start:58 stop:294 length:237 start_codon:yes stop_codon:yes gene_type:complete